MFSFTADQRFHRIDRKVRDLFIGNRLAVFVNSLKVSTGAKVVDLGGRPDHWRNSPVPLDLIFINLEHEVTKMQEDGDHSLNAIAADISDPAFRIPDCDVIYCNSVFEHLSSVEDRQNCATAILNAKRPYWVQIPSIRFPIEPHCRQLFWWRKSQNYRDDEIKRWNASWPFMATQMRQTFPLEEGDLRVLFPEASVYYERILGMEKSINFYSDCSDR